MNRLLLIAFVILQGSVSAQFIMDGPDAPEVNCTFSGGNFEFTLYNTPTSNNYMENYQEFCPNFSVAVPDSNFRFQGYLIYQLTSYSDYVLQYQTDDYNHEKTLTNTSVCRLVGQSDIADTFSDFSSTFFDSTLMQCSTVNSISGANNTGIIFNYTITTDAFTGSSFQPGNTYCFIFFSYAINPYYEDSICMDLRPVLFSKKSASGGINYLCLDPATANVNENLLEEMLVHYQNGIQITSATKGDFVLSSWDGKQIFSHSFNGNTSFPLDVSSGIYLCTIITESGIKSKKLFIP